MRALRFAAGMTVLLAAAAPAVACINDSESDKAEKEFKSRYLHPTAQPAAPEYREADPPGPGLAWGGTAGGLLLFAGAMTIARGPRRPV